MLTLDQRAEISELLEDGLTFREVALRCGAGVATVHRFAKEIDDEATAYLPSPDVIEDECRKIQARWSDEERESRRVGPKPTARLADDYDTFLAESLGVADVKRNPPIGYFDLDNSFHGY